MINKKEEKHQGVLNIYQRINAVMHDVNAVQKESKKVNNQYTFVSHDAVAAALHGPMAKHGIVMLPTVKELKQDGNRTVVCMEIAFINIDTPEDRFTINYYGYGIDPQDKGVGKAISYAVKYALLKVFCLETGDDVEKDHYNYVPSKISEEQVSEIDMLINGYDGLRSRVLKWQGVESTKDILQKEYKAVIGEVRRFIKIQQQQAQGDNL